MKKNELNGLPIRGNLRKALRIMKLTTVLLLVFVFQTFAVVGYAQRAQLTLDMKNISVEDALYEIEQQSDYVFLYNRDLIDVSRKSTLKVKNAKIGTVLEQLFEGSGVGYQVIDRQVVLSVKSAQQQNRTVTGKVTDSSGQSLPGVTVVVKGTTRGTISDLDGNYTIDNVPSDGTLVFSFVGMRTQEVLVGSQSNIDMTMEEDAVGIEEVVAIGYGSLKRKAITGATSTVKMENLSQTGATTVAQLLQGAAAGLTATLSSAQPGGKVNLQIRGSATGRSPLIVIDGFPISDFSNASVGVYSAGSTDAILSSLNPNDIESVDILKDASATSIYGSKAAGGVILITTKRAKTEGLSVDIVSNTGISQVYGLPDMLDATQFMIEKNRADKEKFMYENQITPYGNNDWASFSNYKSTFSQPDFDQWKSNSGVDWQKEVIRTGFLQNYGVTIKGGSKHTKYYTSLGYYDQEGIIRNNDYKKITGQINIDQKIGNKVNVGFTMNLNRTYIDNIPLQEGYAEASDIIRSTLYFPPVIEIKDEDENYNLNPFAPYLSNPVSLLDIISKTKNDRLIANASISYEVFPNLTLKSRLGTDIMLSQGYGYLPISTIMGSRVNGRADERLDDKNDYQFQLFADYSEVFNNHRIMVTLGTEYLSRQKHGFRATNTDFISESFLWYNLAMGAGYPSVGSYGSKSETIGYVGRFNYTYKDRYFATINLRVDGSSNFARNHQWGYFPGLSVGWDMAQEEFFTNKFRNIDQFKLRFGYGQTGNDNIGTAFANYFIPGDKTMYGNVANSSVTLGSLGNPDLKWETQTDLNIGIDYSFLKGRFYGSFEYFNRVISDILGWRSLSSASEVTGISANLNSKKQTFGYEFALNSSIFSSKNFRWNSNLTYTYYRDRWLKRDSSWTPDINNIEKQYFGELWFHLTDGLIQPGEEVTYTSKAIPGTVKLKDIDGYLKDENGAIVLDENKIPQRTGEPDGRINNADLVKIGVNTPFTIGFANQISYKHFNLNLNVYGMFNRWKINSTRQLLADSYWMKDGLNQSTEIINRWNSDNLDGGLPSSLQGLNSFGVGDYYLEKAWFIRFQDINLGYNIPVRGKSLKQLRVFVAIENAFIITPYKGMDPETDSREASYPNQRKFQIGLNLKF